MAGEKAQIKHTRFAFCKLSALVFPTTNLKKPVDSTLAHVFSGLTVGVTVLEGTYAKMYCEVQAAKLSLSALQRCYHDATFQYV